MVSDPPFASGWRGTGQDGPDDKRPTSDIRSQTQQPEFGWHPEGSLAPRSQPERRQRFSLFSAPFGSLSPDSPSSTAFAISTIGNDRSWLVRRRTL